MAAVLDFKAEYAKSGRSSCKACKNCISQDSLRLALMVQSPMFDGKVPNWFHFDCFWKRARVSNPQEIGGFDTLRWDDQEKIKKRIANGDTKKGKKVKDANDTSDFLTEYAKSGGSKCRSCEDKIGKDEVRLGKKDFDSQRAKMYGPQKNWYHIDCFISERDELGFGTDSAPSTIEGYNDLKKEDKDMLIEKLGKGKKRKPGKDTVDSAPIVKKSKEDLEEESQLKEQNKLIWSYRDKLQNEVSKDALKCLLEYNGQNVPPGESRILDALSDVITFGALKSCPECKEGQLKYNIAGYTCTGNATEWTKCMYVTKDPARTAFKIPEEFFDVPFLKKYKYVKRKRIFPKMDDSIEIAKPVSSSVDVVDGSKPLSGCTFAISGKLSMTRPKVAEIIQSLGGEIVPKVSDCTTACLASKAEYEKNRRSGPISRCKKFNIQVISEEFLNEASAGNPVELIKKHSLCTWGSEPSTRIVDMKPGKSLAKSMKSQKQASVFTKSVPSTMKLTVKGGAAVDPESGLAEKAHILEDPKSKEPLNAVLSNVDLITGKNSYYKVQALESDKTNVWYVFRSWGRVGTTIGSTKLDKFLSKNSAIDSFESVFLDKTGNEWVDRKNFVKQPKKFVPLEIDYGQAPDIKLDLSVSSSKLHGAIQDIIRMIFDIESMKRAMLEFEIDLTKMPLGKLSKNQIQNAFKVLTELQELHNQKASTAKILDATTRFYTLIPHDFGMNDMPLLDTEDSIKAKTEMLSNLLDIEIAYSMLKTSDSSEDTIDIYYRKLKTEFKVVDRKSKLFETLVTYVKNTHATTHSHYSLEVLEIFEIEREGEHERFAPFKELHNHKILWHGSRKTNFAGILSQGLRIAPPEAPTTGYMFGKGVYFADMVSKSANYCFTNKNDPFGLMLLGDVALGNMYELTGSQFVTKLPKGKHSTKGLGGTMPDPKGSVFQDNGVEIPMGVGIKSDVKSSLLYNEYIVYDTAQINLKYLFKMKFNHKW